MEKEEEGRGVSTGKEGAKAGLPAPSAEGRQTDGHQLGLDDRETRTDRRTVLWMDSIEALPLERGRPGPEGPQVKCVGEGARSRPPSPRDHRVGSGPPKDRRTRRERRAQDSRERSPSAGRKRPREATPGGPEGEAAEMPWSREKGPRGPWSPNPSIPAGESRSGAAHITSQDFRSQSDIMKRSAGGARAAGLGDTAERSEGPPTPTPRQEGAGAGRTDGVMAAGAWEPDEEAERDAELAGLAEGSGSWRRTLAGLERGRRRSASQRRSRAVGTGRKRREKRTAEGRAGVTDVFLSESYTECAPASRLPRRRRPWRREDEP